MTNTTTHGQVPALHQYTSDLASECQGVARCTELPVKSVYFGY